MPKEHEKRKRECMPRGHEKNNPMLKSMKEKKKGSHILSKATINKKGGHVQRSTKIFRDRKNSKFHTLALLDQNV